MKFRLIPRVAYRTYHTEERLQGLIRFCKRIGADEVMLVPSDYAAEPVWLPEEKIVERAAHTRRSIQTLNENGIAATVNILRVLMPGSHDDETVIGYSQGLVNSAGSENKRFPCPLDPAYCRYMRFLFARMGEVGARGVFVDDDFGHCMVTHDGCFCPLHVAEFNRRYGHNLDRPAIASAYAETPPGPVKRDWVAFHADLVLEMARFFEDALHSTPNDTRLGLMLTSSEFATYAGKTKDVVAALAGGRQPLVRPGQGWYKDYNRIELLEGLMDVVYQQSLLPEGTEMQAEIDSIPHTLFSKGSRVFFDYQVKANIVSRLAKQSVWCFGDEFVDENHPYAATIVKNTPVHAAMARLIPDDAVMEGVGIGHSEVARMLRPKPRPYGPQVPILFWRIGVPITFGESDTVVFTEDSLLLAKEDVFRHLDGRNALVDRNAAAAIQRLGLGEKIGIGSEAFTRREIAPGITAYEAPGRRVAVLDYALDVSRMSERTRILSADLQIHLTRTCEWLSGGALPAYIGGAADVCVNVLSGDGGRWKAVTLLNCSHDPAEECDLRIRKPEGAYTLEYATDSGDTKDVAPALCREEGGYLVVKLSGDLAVKPFDARVIAVRFLTSATRG